MAMAPVVYTLWQEFLSFDPNDPIWEAARQEWGDRFSIADLDMRRWLSQHDNRGSPPPRGTR